MKITKVDEDEGVKLARLSEGDLFMTETTDSIFKKGTAGHAARIIDKNGFLSHGVCTFNPDFEVQPVEIVEVKYREK